MQAIITLATAAALVAGCSNIATVNGVPVNQSVTTSSQGAESYCAANPAVCIIGGAVGLGIFGYMVRGTGPIGDPVGL